MRQYVNKWMILYYDKILFTKAGSSPALEDKIDMFFQIYTSNVPFLAPSFKTLGRIIEKTNTINVESITFVH